MTFALDGDTTYHEASDATPADVSVGDEVSVKVDGGGRSSAATVRRRPGPQRPRYHGRPVAPDELLG